MSKSVENSIGLKLVKVVKLKRHFIDIEIKELGLSRTQWQVLFWLQILGSCTQKELLANLDIDAGHLARVLEEFEKNKYITRSPSKEDRRSLFIQITPYTEQKLLPKIEKAIHQEDTVLLKGLKADERNQLKNLLNKLEENLKKVLEKE